MQEALSNAVKHAAAERVTVEIVEDDDDGDAARSPTTGRASTRTLHGEGFGLLGMQERVELVGGSAVSVGSSAAAGAVRRSGATRFRRRHRQQLEPLAGQPGRAHASPS